MHHTSRYLLDANPRPGSAPLLDRRVFGSGPCRACHQLGHHPDRSRPQFDIHCMFPGLVHLQDQPLSLPGMPGAEPLRLGLTAAHKVFPVGIDRDAMAAPRISWTS